VAFALFTNVHALQARKEGEGLGGDTSRCARAMSGGFAAGPARPVFSSCHPPVQLACCQ